MSIDSGVLFKPSAAFSRYGYCRARITSRYISLEDACFFRLGLSGNEGVAVYSPGRSSIVAQLHAARVGRAADTQARCRIFTEYILASR